MYGNELVNPYNKSHWQAYKFLSALFRLAQTLNYGDLSLKKRSIDLLLSMF